MTSSVTLDETLAAQDEGIRKIDPRSNELRIQWLALKAARDEIDKKMNGIRDELGATLVVDGMQAMTENGKVVVRLSSVTSHSLDSAALKKANPTLFSSLMATFSKVTRSERMTIK